MITEMVKKHGTNLLKTGIVVVFANLANQMLREMARHTDAKQKGLWKPRDPWYHWWSIAGSNR